MVLNERKTITQYSVIIIIKIVFSQVNTEYHNHNKNICKLELLNISRIIFRAKKTKKHVFLISLRYCWNSRTKNKKVIFLFHRKTILRLQKGKLNKVSKFGNNQSQQRNEPKQTLTHLSLYSKIRNLESESQLSNFAKLFWIAFRYVHRLNGGYFHSCTLVVINVHKWEEP